MIGNDDSLGPPVSRDITTWETADWKDGDGVVRGSIPEMKGVERHLIRGWARLGIARVVAFLGSALPAGWTRLKCRDSICATKDEAKSDKASSKASWVISGGNAEGGLPVRRRASPVWPDHDNR